MISVEVNILSFRTLISGFHYPECAASDLAVVNISRCQVSRLILQHCGQEEKRGECEKHLIKNGLLHTLIWLHTQLQNLDHTLLFVLLAATQPVTPPRHSVNKDTFSGAGYKGSGCTSGTYLMVYALKWGVISAIWGFEWNSPSHRWQTLPEVLLCLLLVSM